jgi:LasA protease
LGWRDPQRKGLYHQLAWAANNLNQGYYLWRVGALASLVLSDGRVVPLDATINAGTAGVQYYYSLLSNYKDWKTAVSSEGLFATYSTLFGYPFDLAVEPLLPLGLQQPLMQLPFEPGGKWAFTGGPHAGWDSGSAWAALDFAPADEALGCNQSDKWVVAMLDGLITRSENGIVLQDVNDPNGLLSDGLEQTGWLILYMHIETRDRVEVGAYLRAGQRIGHPSCEGGVSTGTHVHIARRYNGEWISADQDIPFVLDGWVSIGTGTEYEGYLERNNKKVEAESGNSTKNVITR